MCSELQHTKESAVSANAKRNTIHLVAPRSLTAAVKAAAARELTTNSEYVRRAVIERLRADGVEPSQHAPAEQTAA
jgi:hypothetical protein